MLRQNTYGNRRSELQQSRENVDPSVRQVGKASNRLPPNSYFCRSDFRQTSIFVEPSSNRGPTWPNLIFKTLTMCSSEKLNFKTCLTKNGKRALSLKHIVTPSSILHEESATKSLKLQGLASLAERSRQGSRARFARRSRNLWSFIELH